MDTIYSPAKDVIVMSHEAGHDSAHHFRRAARHGQEAERLFRMGDDRQAAMHASISRKHTAAAMELDKTPKHGSRPIS
ncbi:MAG: hypothetical protein KA287_00280 [Rhodoferax sp.]|nr:hypothetical protein [Rhodoferax sp.]MBP6492661.1 hypothetical protein [Rhodoferax sp.]MBP7572379.1 hypothetical protein [Rhodoferax sp.]HPW06220.1 hypothetical protein [Burkholderiaceae bacterium]